MNKQKLKRYNRRKIFLKTAKQEIFAKKFKAGMEQRVPRSNDVW